MGHPSKDVEKLLKENGLQESLPKLKENQITPSIFWELNEDQLEKVLGIEVYGVRKTLAMQMEKLLKEHKKTFEKSEEELSKESFTC